jgi:serine/threonine protein kinase/Leucine-rich repeat (LRR) protein
VSESKAEVVVSIGGAVVESRVFPTGAYRIGRDASCDIQLDEGSVSSQHARLIVAEGGVEIEDLGSVNGTFIGDMRVSGRAKVRPGEKVSVGAAVLEVRRDGSKAKPAAEFLRGPKYEIGAAVARGGMGAILSARENATGRNVAMKVMLDQSDAEEMGRFIDEAQITAQLEHPNVVPIHELSVDDSGRVFYTMKFVKGVTLLSILQGLEKGDIEATKKYQLPALLNIFQKICDALAFAHSKRVLHRDLKPENIMIGDFGEVQVMDWGLAKVLGSKESADVIDAKREAFKKAAAVLSKSMGNKPAPVPAVSVAPADPRRSVVKLASSDTGNKTQAGMVFGTPQYMSPEQARGEVDKHDERADIYSLGAILYHILSLKPSITGDDPWKIVKLVGRGKTDSLDVKKKVPHIAGGQIPESLAAVVRKAMQWEPEKRYASVRELQADIAAYQNGFATSAEKAGAMKRFGFFVKRNKILAASVVIVVVLTAGFMAKVIASEKKARANERRAVDALSKLAGTAPTFAAQAEALIGKRDFAGALEKIEFATSLAPDDAEYWFVKGNILESLQRLADARDAYVLALARKPGHVLARENAAFCDGALKQENNPGQLSGDTRNRLQNLMRSEGRVAEAIALLGALGKDKKAIYDTWRAALDRAGIRQQLNQGDDGLLSLDLTRSGIDSLEALRGMPLVYLNIALTKVSDLGPLAGMPLKSLNITGCAQVHDLTPLKGMKLQVIEADSVSVSDLGPLSGMPLETLHMRGTKVSALDALRGLPLHDLALGGSRVSDLAPLRGLPLISLSVGQSAVSDLSPIKGMPLKTLDIGATRIKDLAPLKDMPLTGLSIGGTDIRDLAPLRGMKLENLSAERTPVSDLAPLEGMPLANLGLISTAVRDLSPLKNAKIKILDIRDTPVTDLAPLRGQPIETLLCFGDRIPDLTPVQTMPLKRLWAFGAKLNDLAFLRNVPLDELCLDGSAIADIRGLAGMPLRTLVLTRTSVRDLTPLASCRKLEQLAFPPECKDIEFLRQLPALQRLDTDWGSGTGVLKPAAVFWKEFDAKKGAK